MHQDDFNLDVREMQSRGLIHEITGELKSGKEATVYLATSQAGPLVVKHFRALAGRRFHTDATYRQGREMHPRDARAFERRSRYGRAYAQSTWIAAEFAMLRRLNRAGLPAVPRVLARVGGCIVMEFIAARPGEPHPAPRLIDARIDPQAAARLHAEIMLMVISMFERHVVHADLSPYNILVPQRPAQPGRSATRLVPVIIDFPQAVDPRKNPVSRDLLIHDVEQVTQYFQRIDPRVSHHQLATRLWARFEAGQL